ncbi:LPS-assembly protein LptD [Nitrosomonas mobilis]|uniref:LPS-assembly protein LptD n=2 Tax=Nitrosomonas mobilis TaxID=51642 RepID=A0A1G5SDQ8_9PROT|nr:LPS-assembly protein LptD [Nitrosomonas mobilis]
MWQNQIRSVDRIISDKLNFHKNSMSQYKFLYFWHALLLMVPVPVAGADQLFDSGARLPVYVEADRFDGYAGREIEASGNVRMRQGDLELMADRVKYYQDSEDVEVQGNATLNRSDDILRGSLLQLNLQTGIGELSDPLYFIKDGSGRGGGKILFLEGDDQYRLKQARYTTCQIGDDDWYIHASDLTVDKAKKVGTARNVTVHFKDVPFLYLPWMNFSFGGQRKTGLLAPIFGNTARSGAEVSVPFYWNIAPNYDATITPRYMSKRGLMFNNEFRYLGQSLGGQLMFDILPDDLITNETRYGVAFNHNQWLGNGWMGSLHYERASDSNYFRDLANNVAFTSRTNLPQQAIAAYSGGLGHDGSISFNILMQQFQTLQDPLATIVSPYKRLPQLTLNATKRNVYGLDFDLASNWTHFSHPTLQDGLRLALYPSVSIPLQNSWGFIKPRIGVHHTRYNLNAPTGIESKTINRTLPILSLDSGLVFERDVNLWQGKYVQTLEPRMFYVYIPFEQQNNLPNFDSAEMDFSFAQIFSERRFSGEDRINDANEITMAVTSRLIESSTGNERIRATVGQKVRLAERRLTLTSPQTTAAGADFIAELSGRITPHILTDAGVQLDQNNFLTEKIRAGISYHPQPGKVLNVGYRFSRDVFEQMDISTQWPLTRKWQALASANYSLKDDKLLAGLLGVEYNACCWSLRLVANRFTTATQRTSTTVFVQLELNDLMSIGTNPIRVLQQGISGYTRTSIQ